jgi:rRNA maturation RNase YbeY
MRELILRNAQRALPVRLALLRRLMTAALEDDLGVNSYELGVHLVGPVSMARVNERYLGHEGATDVITFDYGAPGGPLYGELYICPAVAVAQARAFRTTWQAELVRYAIHGLLHLRGYDDISDSARRVMKQREGRILRQLQSRYALHELG